MFFLFISKTQNEIKKNILFIIRGYFLLLCLPFRLWYVSHFVICECVFVDSITKQICMRERVCARRNTKKHTRSQIARPAVCIRWSRKCTILLFVQLLRAFIGGKSRFHSEREQKRRKKPASKRVVIRLITSMCECDQCNRFESTDWERVPASKSIRTS